MPTASVASKAPPSLPHTYARTVGLTAWHVLSSIAALGARRAAEEDERTEQLAREHPNLKREPRMAWVVEGGQERICEYLCMPERTLRRCLRDLEETWFPDGGFFAIWRKDRAKQRQEVNAYDLDELIGRIEARLAHPSLPLEDAIKLAPGDAEQPALPLDADRCDRQVSPAAAPAAPAAGDVAGATMASGTTGAREAAAPLPETPASSGPPPAFTGTTEGRERAPEAGLPRASRVIRERDALLCPRPSAEEAVLVMALVMALHPDQLRQVLAENEPLDASAGDGVTGSAGSAPPSGGEGETSAGAPVTPQATSCEAGGQNGRQGSRSRDRRSLHDPTETTYARSAVVDPGSSRDQDEILKTALRIRQAVPTYWHRDALHVARRFGPRHVDLCLKYLAIERQRRRIDDVAKWLSRIFREARSSWLSAYIAHHEQRELARRALRQRPAASVPQGFDAGALRARLQGLAATVRGSRLGARLPDLASDVAARIEALAATFQGDVTIPDLEAAEAELETLDTLIAQALAATFTDEAENARAAAAAALRPHAASMPPEALAATLRDHAALRLREILGLPRLATFYMDL